MKLPYPIQKLYIIMLPQYYYYVEKIEQTHNLIHIKVAGLMHGTHSFSTDKGLLSVRYFYNHENNKLEYNI